MDYSTGLPVLHCLPQSLLKLTSIELVMLPNHSFSAAPSSFALNHSQLIRVFSNELALRIRWSKYSSYSFSIDPSNKYSISFRIDWFDLPAVHGTLKSLLQRHSSKASVLQHSPFFMVLTPIHNYWKNHSLDKMDLCQRSNLSAF